MLSTPTYIRRRNHFAFCFRQYRSCTAPYDQVLVPFARAVEEESGGRIEVALKPMGGYGKPA